MDVTLPEEASTPTLGKKLGFGCLLILGLLVGLMILGSTVASDKTNESAELLEATTIAEDNVTAMPDDTSATV